MNTKGRDWEAIVVGGGHAGIEAALALARVGHRTLLVTQNPDAIGRMSCNPAVGGLGKGNLVREIDALGGEMGRLIDGSMIQFRMLNSSRGAAVQAPRAQADKALYSRLARKSLESQAGLSILMDTVVDLLVEDGAAADAGPAGRIAGVVTERGSRIGASVVVLTTGTFMEGRVFIGDHVASSGRLGEPAALGLGPALRGLGFPLGRLKTGTPARIKAGSVDFSRLERDEGDPLLQPFSFTSGPIERPRVPCWLAWTNAATHETIRSNLGTSPLFGGKIVGRGPRYCPSIEDKVVRFPERDRHQVFVEPEGFDTDELYLNGLSTSLPEFVQRAFIRTIAGLGEAELVRPGYAVEYDFLDPRDLLASLESKRLPGLFVAGQTNGTSGYEEAAAQGLIAGLNASRALEGAPPLVLGRGEAYIGVLVDDITTLGAEEPYRIFTSRAERRLALRHDSADRRLTPRGIESGLVDVGRRELFERRMEGLAEVKSLLAARRITVADAATEPLLLPHVGESIDGALRDPRIAIEVAIGLVGELARFPADWLRTAELDLRYAGYEAKEERLAARFESSELKRIPAGFDFTSVGGLSAEAREKLAKARPLTLGQLARIPGVRKSDAALVLIALSRREGAGLSPGEDR